VVAGPLLRQHRGRAAGAPLGQLGQEPGHLVEPSLLGARGLVLDEAPEIGEELVAMPVQVGDEVAHPPPSPGHVAPVSAISQNAIS
jgi:hypothetical protein